MRRTNVLLQQHLGKLFLKHWKTQGKRVVRDTGANKNLKELGYSVTDAKALVNEVPEKKFIPIAGFRPKELSLDSSHPDYHEEPCLKFGDHNVLLEGLEQAKLLTNTVEIEVGTLPESVRTYFDPEKIPIQDKLVRRAIKSSSLFDAEQKKLPKRTDPERPAWNFPRDYGITDRRKNYLLCNKLVQLCASVSSDLCTTRRTISDGTFCVPLRRSDRDILISLRADVLVMSPKPLKPILDPKMSLDVSLPVLDPVSPVISLEKQHIYNLESLYPLLEGSSSPHIQIALIHHNETEVVNLYETEVTETQILGRSLMKSFTFAAAQARHLYGSEVVDLPTPLVMQCVQTDGRNFHFSILQLNTLKEDGPIHNIYWSLPRIPLYETCDYIDGKPVLEGYNPDVFKLLHSFYKNGS